MEITASMENSDKSLLEAHLQGDQAAFGELVRRHGDSVLGYLIRMSPNREQAEDLFQETFKRVHEKAHTFRGPQFRGWLFRIATNVALDGRRRIKRFKAISLNHQFESDNPDSEQLGAIAPADNSCNPSEQASKAEQAEQVRQAIELLPERQRATLVLAYYQQLSYTDVAEVLGCSVGTVKTQMFRALRTLADKLPEI
jgi:RNA polymerase sigma-70 factor (ECF subfamily)